MKRRMAAAAAFVLVSGSAATRAQIAATYGSTLTTVTTEKIADGVYAFMAPDSKTPFVSGNSLAVIGRDAVLIVDTGHVPAVTRKMIAEIRRLTPAPVRFVVNTHWHFDHVVGNGEYREAFPGVTIVSTASTRTHLQDVLPGYAKQLVEQVGAGIPTIRAMLKDGKRRDGTALSAEDRDFYEAEIHDFEPALAALQEMKPALPTLTFERELDVDLGGRAVRVLHLGRGNTAGDAVVYVPDARVVATGDLVVAPVPYATASFMFDWPDTMRALMALKADTIVPGHGPLFHDWRYAQSVVDLIASINTQTEKAVEQGKTLEEAKKQVDVSAFRQELAGGDPFQRRIFDTFFLPGAVERSFTEARFRAEK
jgi:cyclase